AEPDKHGLDPSSKLKGGVAVAPEVGVDAGAGEDRLAGVQGLAAAEHRGDPLLRTDVGLAAGAAPARRSARLKVARLQPLSLGDLLAAAVADPDRQRLLGTDLVDVGVAAGGA